MVTKLVTTLMEPITTSLQEIIEKQWEREDKKGFLPKTDLTTWIFDILAAFLSHQKPLEVNG